MKSKFTVEKKEDLKSICIDKDLRRNDIKPGDIIISVGTIDPKLTEETLKEEFDKYSDGSYDRLYPLLNPVKIGQFVVSRSHSGHNDSVHAGLCVGLDEEGIPIITDLHGHVQDMSIHNYYTPTTLRIFRPNLDPILFDKARESLLNSASQEDKDIWDNRNYVETNQIFIPGRLDSKWDQSVGHVLKIALSPSNFFSPSNKVLSKTEEQMICSKLVIETYKILLIEMARYLQITEEHQHDFVRNYMNLLDNTTPKTLEGYLIDNVNYSQFIIPTENQIFDRLESEIMDNHDLESLYNEIKGTEHSQYTKASIFVNEVGKRGIKLPEQLDLFLRSQAIIYGENIPDYELEHNTENISVSDFDKKSGSHHELAKQYREGKKIFEYILNSEIMDSCDELKEAKEEIKKKFEQYKSLYLYHEKNKGIIDKSLGYEAKTLLVSGTLLTGVAYLMLKKASPSTFLWVNEQALNLMKTVTSTIKSSSESQEISVSPKI